MKAWLPLELTLFFALSFRVSLLPSVVRATGRKEPMDNKNNWKIMGSSDGNSL